MPKRGDKLYNCFNGELKTVTFERVVDRAEGYPQYLVRPADWKLGDRLTCIGHDYYKETELEAVEEDLASFVGFLPGVEVHVQAAKDNLAKCRNEIARLQARVDELKAEENVKPD